MKLPAGRYLSAKNARALASNTMVADNDELTVTNADSQYPIIAGVSFDGCTCIMVYSPVSKTGALYDDRHEGPFDGTLPEFKK